VSVAEGLDGRHPPADEYDVVVVGAGPAGCVLAGRLSERPSLRVLLLGAEASEDGGEGNTTTAPQAGLGGRALSWPGRQVLGGSSATDPMVYLRPLGADYDAWAAEPGDRSWSSEHVLPLFRRMEHNARGPDRRRGVGGPLPVERPPSPHPWVRAAVQSAVAAGYRRNGDFDAGDLDGVGTYQLAQRRGRPLSATDAYLRPALGRPNLTLRTGARTTRVLVSGGRATGVEYRCGGEVRTALASSEVVLTGGAVHTPRLLMLSGVGPADHLREVGIGVVQDLPGVGRGLQDQPVVPVVWSVRADRSPFRSRWRGTRGAGTSSALAEAGLFTRSRPDLPAPDLQLHFLPGSWPADAGAAVDGFTTAVVLVRVQSSGSVRLRSADPTGAPVLDPGYLTDEHDLDALVCGVEKAREVAGSGPLAAVLAEERSPGGTVGSAEGLRRSVRATLQPLSAPASSCRMGSDGHAVVDPELRVRGIEGLRVADASVLPTPVRGTTGAVAMMIAERAADLVLGRGIDPELAAAR